MAQIGCPVPAAAMRLSPVDRLFTRLGANDNLIAGLLEPIDSVDTVDTFVMKISEN